MTWKRKENIWYRCGHFLSTLITMILFRPLIEGKNNIPKTGPILIAPNHRSMLDIPALGTAIYRPMRFMAKKDLFKNKFVKWYFETNGSFSVDKSDSDPAAVKKAVSILKSGDALVIFPEGKRNKEDNIGELMPGAGFIAIKSNVPILPVAITGTDKLFSLNKNKLPTISRLKIVIGKPLTVHIGSNLKTSENLKVLLPVLKNSLQELYDYSVK